MIASLTTQNNLDLKMTDSLQNQEAKPRIVPDKYKSLVKNAYMAGQKLDQAKKIMEAIKKTKKGNSPAGRKKTRIVLFNLDVLITSLFFW